MLNIQKYSPSYKIRIHSHYYVQIASKQAHKQMKGNQMLQQTVISRTSDIVRVENKYHNYYHSSFEHLTKRAIISASPAESEQTITKFRISTPFTYDLSVSKIIVSVRKKQN